VEIAKIIKILKDQALGSKNRADAIRNFYSYGIVEDKLSDMRAKEYSELAEAFSEAAEIIESGCTNGISMW
jgi:hypothetical protein